jgi:hypothetical protein
MNRDPREAIAPLLAFASTLRATSKLSRSYASSPKTGYPLHDILAAMTAAAQSPSGELTSNRKCSESWRSESELSEAVGAPLLRPYTIVNGKQS